MNDVSDPNMLKWWAQYTESQGNMAEALKIYQKADDWFSQVTKLTFWILGEILNNSIFCRFESYVSWVN